MKTPEEIKKALKLHKGGSSCTKCPYYGGFGEDYACMPGLITDVLAHIDQLEETIDLMKIQMRGDCGTCKHRDVRGEPCDTCGPDHNRPAWEYEGLPELPKKGDS